MIKESIQKLAYGGNLTFGEAGEAMREIISGKATTVQIAGFLVALKMKGETIEEITAFAEIMRENCCQIEPNVKGRLVDTCGTGGDKVKTFNVSTAAALVAAGAGSYIAKHGNRSVTSRSGSADIMERFGFNLKMTPDKVQKSIEQVGIGFMFAPVFHPSMKHAVEPRRELGLRTVFNILGPLANPACADAQVVGVYDPKLTEPLAHVLNKLGCKEAMVLHGLDGLDEISTIGKTRISHLRNGKIDTFTIKPEDFGVKRAQISEIQGTTPDESAELVFKIFNGYVGVDDPKTEMVIINAAAAIMMGEKATNFRDGMELALESIISGAAYKKLKMLVMVSDGNKLKLEDLESKYA